MSRAVIVHRRVLVRRQDQAGRGQYQIKTQNKVRVLYLHLRVVNWGKWAMVARIWRLPTYLLGKNLVQYPLHQLRLKCLTIADQEQAGGVGHDKGGSRAESIRAERLIAKRTQLGRASYRVRWSGWAEADDGRVGSGG